MTRKESKRKSGRAARACLALLIVLAGCDQFAVYPLLDGAPVLSPGERDVDAGETAEFEISGGSPPYEVSVTPASGTIVLAGARVEYTSETPGPAVIRVTDDLGSWAEATVYVRGL